MNNKNVLMLIISFLLIISNVMADEDNGAVATTNYIELYKNNNNFDLPPGSTSGGEVKNEATNVTASKKLTLSDKKNSGVIELTVKMPPKPAKLDIVLAMDTSGSMVQHYQENHLDTTYFEWASKAITPIIEQYPDARVSIVSWDDEDELGDSQTRFYNVTSERRDIEHELNRLSKEECVETDNTVYSIGVKRAVQVLDNKSNWPVDPYNTARIIIFVTGLSEFRAEPRNASKSITLEDQLAIARSNRTYEKGTNFSGYQIFPIQIGIDPRFKLERDNLSKISNGTHISGLPSNEPISINNINDLSDKIDGILRALKSRTLAHDVVVTDTLYPYLDYLRSNSSLYTNYGSKQILVSVKNSSDGSTTLIWNIGKMDGSDIWKASIDIKLNLSLPVEVSPDKTKTEFQYKIANTTPVSEVRYTWITEYRGIIPLPEGKIVLSLGNSLSKGNGISEKDNTKLTIKAESAKRSTLKEQPGFEAVSAVGCLISAIFLLGKRKRL